MNELEASLEEFDLMYTEACDQVNLTQGSLGPTIEADGSMTITYKAQNLTLSSPLLANTELSVFDGRPDPGTRAATEPSLVSPFHGDVSPTSACDNRVAAMRPPHKPSITRASTEAMDRPRIKSRSLSSTPYARVSFTADCAMANASPTAPPFIKRRSTFTSSSSVSSHSTYSSSASTSSTSTATVASIGNPFYKHLVHKKDYEFGLVPDEDLLVDCAHTKKRKVSRQNLLETYLAEATPDLAELFAPYSLPFDRSLSDFFNILEDA